MRAVTTASEGGGMFCKKCGSQLEDGSRFCSHCGSAVDNVFTGTPDAAGQVPPQQNYNSQQQYYAQPQQQQTETNIYAILGFIFAFIVPIAGLILSIIGLQKKQYHGLAVAGLILSICFIVLIIIAVIIIISSPSYYYYRFPFYPYK